jgi:hypothetical protein
MRFIIGTHSHGNSLAIMMTIGNIGATNDDCPRPRRELCQRGIRLIARRDFLAGINAVRNDNEKEIQ